MRVSRKNTSLGRGLITSVLSEKQMKGKFKMSHHNQTDKIRMFASLWKVKGIQFESFNVLTRISSCPVMLIFALLYQVYTQFHAPHKSVTSKQQLRSEFQHTEIRPYKTTISYFIKSLSLQFSFSGVAVSRSQCLAKCVILLMHKNMTADVSSLCVHLPQKYISTAIHNTRWHIIYLY